MARRSTTSTFRGRTYTRRGTFWGRSPADTGVTILAKNTAVIDSTAVPVVQGETIVRTRGFINVRSDQVDAAEDGPGALGACVLSDEAVAAAGAAVPTPYSNADSDMWFLHQFFDWSVSLGAHEFNPLQRYEFDSKAMRKMQQGETLAFIVENGSVTNGLEYYLHFAVLFKVA